MSRLSLLAAGIISGAAAMGVNGLTVRDSADCDAVHLFLARGNNEPYPGRQRAMIELICDGVSDCGYEDLIYSGVFTDLYCQTAYDGVHAAYAQVSDYACQCPDAKLVLLGYSQGGQIMTDFLGGGGGTLFNGCVQPPTPALDRSTFPGNQVSAVVVFGDARHTGRQPYNQGGGSRFDGVFPRSDSQLEALEDWTSVLYAYCADHDPICARDQPESNWNGTEHLNYYDVHAEEAAAWVKSVASISDGARFTTALATSISGTVQDYATIPTSFTPSGTVRSQAISTARCAATSRVSSSSDASTTEAPTSTSAASSSETTSPASSTEESVDAAEETGSGVDDDGSAASSSKISMLGLLGFVGFAMLAGLWE